MFDSCNSHLCERTVEGPASKLFVVRNCEDLHLPHSVLSGVASELLELSPARLACDDRPWSEHCGTRPDSPETLSVKWNFLSMSFIVGPMSVVLGIRPPV